MSFFQENIFYIWLLPVLQIFIPLCMLAVWNIAVIFGYILQESRGTEKISKQATETDPIAA
jgi:hypothetical protein